MCDAGDGCFGCLGYVKGKGKDANCLTCPDLDTVPDHNFPAYLVATMVIPFGVFVYMVSGK